MRELDKKSRRKRAGEKEQENESAGGRERNTASDTGARPKIAPICPPI